MQAMAETLDYEGLKKAVLPAVHTLCLGTTSGERDPHAGLVCTSTLLAAELTGTKATMPLCVCCTSSGLRTVVNCHLLIPTCAAAAVRVGAFACMSRLVSRLDQGEAEAMLATAVKAGGMSCHVTQHCDFPSCCMPVVLPMSPAVASWAARPCVMAEQSPSTCHPFMPPPCR